jgi:tetratricopeptide (TPR) repeat protein
MVEGHILLFLTIVIFCLSAAGEDDAVKNLINTGMALCNPVDHRPSPSSYEDAINYFEKAIAQNPSSPEAWYEKGLALGNLGAYEDGKIKKNNYYKEAKICYERAIQLNPDYEDAFRELAWIESRMDNSGKGFELIEKAIDMNPNDAEAYNTKGEIFFYLNNFDDALIWYHKAITINPKNSNAWYNIGKTEEELGHEKEAGEAYQKSNEIDSKR